MSYTSTIDYENGVKICPQCGKKGDIESCFGWRDKLVRQTPQSWCFECRGGVDKELEPLPTKLAQLRREYKHHYPKSRTMLKPASFYIKALLKTGKYKE